MNTKEPTKSQGLCVDPAKPGGEPLPSKGSVAIAKLDAAGATDGAFSPR